MIDAKAGAVYCNHCFSKENGDFLAAIRWMRDCTFGEAITAGSKVYWDVADAVAKTDDETGANKLIGKTIAAAGDDDTTVRVRLSQ